MAGADGAGVRFTGRLALARLGDVPARLDACGAIATIDLSAIDRIDTVGAWIVTRTAKEHGSKVVGASAEAERLLDALASDKSEYRVHRDRRPAWLRLLAPVGDANAAVLHELLGLVGFLAAFIIPPGTPTPPR